MLDSSMPFDWFFMETLKFSLFGAVVAYVIQGVRTCQLYKMEGFEKFRAHAPLCWMSAAYCFVGLLLFVPIPPVARECLVMSQLIVGVLTTYHYSRSLGAFLEYRGPIQKTAERIFLGVAGLMGSMILARVTIGYSVFADRIPDAGPLFVQATGGLLVPNRLSQGILAVAILSTAVLTTTLARRAWSQDRWLAFGAGFSFFAVVNDTVLFNIGFKYFFPLVFIANAIEIFRITALGEREIQVRNQVLLKKIRLATFGELAGGIAHEIRTPLSVILLSANLAGQDARPEQKSFLDSVERAVKQITQIVEGMLRIVRNDSDSKPVDTHLSNLLAEVFQVARIRSNRHGVALTSDIQDDLWLKCRSSEITQAVMNLLNNSIEAVRDLKEPWVRLTAHKSEERIEITVVDSGPGIPPEIAARITEPFFTTKPVGEGTGLGLSLAKRFVESNGGEFFLDSTCSNTRFVMSLPAETDEMHVPEPTSPLVRKSA